jgi:hypothetical protein
MNEPDFMAELNKAMTTNEDYVRGVVNQATDVAKKLKGTKLDEVRKWVDGADVVVGAFNDRAQPYGVGLHIIKGQQLLMTYVTEQWNMTGLRQLCLPCRNLDEVIAYQLVFGEPDGQSQSPTAAPAS